MGDISIPKNPIVRKVLETGGAEREKESANCHRSQDAGDYLPHVENTDAVFGSTTCLTFLSTSIPAFKKSFSDVPGILLPFFRSMTV
jgi:hypothetical protein